MTRKNFKYSKKKKSKRNKRTRKSLKGGADNNNSEFTGFNDYPKQIEIDLSKLTPNFSLGIMSYNQSNESHKIEKEAEQIDGHVTINEKARHFVFGYKLQFEENFAAREGSRDTSYFYLKLKDCDKVIIKGLFAQQKDTDEFFFNFKDKQNLYIILDTIISELKKAMLLSENEKFSIRSLKINREEFVLDDECTAGSITETTQREIDEIKRKIERLREKIKEYRELLDDAETKIKELNGNLRAAYYNQDKYIFFEGNCLQKKVEEVEEDIYLGFEEVNK